MTKAILSLFLCVSLVFGLAGNARAALMHPATPGHLAGGGVIDVADAPLDGLSEIFRMEPDRLLFLGGGILTGLLLLSPQLGIAELYGVAVGVIGAEFVYHTYYRSNRWF